MRRLLAVSTVVLVLSAMPADAQTISWTDQFGSHKNDTAWGVATTTDAVYTVGETNGTLPGQTSAGGTDAWIRRSTTDGHEVWTTQFGTDGVDRGFAVAPIGTTLYVAGQETSASGQDDGFLAAFDQSGTQLWMTTFGTSGPDFASFMVTDGTNLYVVGSTHGLFEGQQRHRRGDAFIAAFDTTGTMLWADQFGSSQFDAAYGAAVTPNGILVSGYTAGAIEGARNHGGYDAFAALFATDGSEVWLKQFGTKQTDIGYGVGSDANGDYVSGVTYGAFKGQTQHRNGDAFVRRFDPTDGSLVWVRQFGTNGLDLALAVATHGTDVVVGGSTDLTFGGQTNAGGDDAFVKVLDAATGANGSVLQWGSSGNDFLYWMTVDGDTLDAVGVAGGAMPEQTALGHDDAFVTSISLAG
jgi:hypothetical protein